MPRRKTTEQFIREAREIHNDWYLYFDTIYKNGHKKISIICPIHGVFQQTPSNHLNGHGCNKCGYENRLPTGPKKLTTEQWIKKAQKVHGDRYDYSDTIYNGSTKKLTIRCPKHGQFEQLANSHTYNGHGCLECSKEKARERLREINSNKQHASPAKGGEADRAGRA